MVYAGDLKSPIRKDVRVRVPPAPPAISKCVRAFFRPPFSTSLYEGWQFASVDGWTHRVDTTSRYTCSVFRQVVLVALALSASAACRDDVRTVADAGGGAGADATVPPEHASPTAAGVAYFADIGSGLTGPELVGALHRKLAADHVSLSFDALYDAYQALDQGREGCTGIYDFYSSKCWQPEQACGNYTREGDCFNREHSWPKSWWGGATAPNQHQDLVAVIPADGFVNNTRSQLPLGPVISATYTSSNGSKRGLCNVAGTEPGSACFEPPDALKGDFARIYFYMAVRYEGEFSCCAETAVNRADLVPWQETMLRDWHAIDPVDIAERNRNEDIFGIQRNRNPFVDYPTFVDRIDDF